jgi:hypothetical protein
MHILSRCRNESPKNWELGFQTYYDMTCEKNGRALQLLRKLRSPRAIPVNVDDVSGVALELHLSDRFAGADSWRQDVNLQEKNSRFKDVAEGRAC